MGRSVENEGSQGALQCSPGKLAFLSAPCKPHSLLLFIFDRPVMKLKPEAVSLELRTTGMEKLALEARSFHPEFTSRPFTLHCHWSWEASAPSGLHFKGAQAQLSPLAYLQACWWLHGLISRRCSSVLLLIFMLAGGCVDLSPGDATTYSSCLHCSWLALFFTGV